MHDPRVVRGSTYAAKLENTNAKGIELIIVILIAF